MSATEIVTSNDCSCARVDEEQPYWPLLVHAFPMAGDPPTARVADGAPLPDARHYTRKFGFLDESAMGRLLAASVRIASDMDEPGQRVADAPAKCIGYATCRRVSRPAGGKDVHVVHVVLVNLGAPVVRDALAGAKSYLMPALPAHGTRPARTLPPSRGRRPVVELASVEASHAR